MPLITIEGIDGSGKTSQVEILYNFLTAQGLKVASYREPGGTYTGEDIREFIMNTKQNQSEGLQQVSARTELMLFLASRAQLTEEVIAPKLAEDWVVILDRFICSSAVYQGWNGNIPMKDVLKASMVATQGIAPNATLFIDVDPQVAIDRIKGRKNNNSFDLVDIYDMQTLRTGYQQWYKDVCPYPYAIIDGNDSIQAVANAILKVVWTDDNRIIPERIRKS